MEKFYPLHAFVCSECFLVQLEEFESPEEIFSDYLYFSSFSESWLRHAARYTEQITEKLQLSKASFVVEIASNDGYLLQNFVKRNIPCLGIEPAKNVALVAIEKGVPTRSVFFGTQTATDLVREGYSADLVIANNVLAHVPDINDFVAGIATVLKPEGVATLEFPHLYQLLENNQFDTIYHEHFSYLSLLAVEKICTAHGLRVFAVDELLTHGGSLRVYADLHKHSHHPVEPSLEALRALEKKAHLDCIETYDSFRPRVEKVKSDLLSYLIAARAAGKKIAAYGAAAKGNTLLNYCGIREDFIEYIVDKNPHKQGLFTPGTHIPVYAPEKIFETKPDVVVILPWNLKREVQEQLAGIRAWGGRFIVPVPHLEEF
jgi:SAM-dependent methyltransferase